MSDHDELTNAYAPVPGYSRGVPYTVAANGWEANHSLSAVDACALAARLACTAIDGFIGHETYVRYQALHSFLSDRMRVPFVNEASVQTYTVADAHRLAAEAIEWWGTDASRKSVAAWAQVD